MPPLRQTLFALTCAMLVVACAGAGPPTSMPAVGTRALGASDTGTPAEPADPRLRAMREMHQKMSAATTAAARQALMADHLKAMQDGMAMLQERSAASREPPGPRHRARMPGIGSRAGIPGTVDMDDPPPAPIEPAAHRRSMARQIALLQLMMDMLVDRVPQAATRP